MVAAFEQEIEELKRRLLAEGAMVEDAIAKAVFALIKKDEALATSVMNAHAEVDRAEMMIEEECLRIQTLHNPVATDLRFVITVLKTNEDLERMGDLAAKIARRTLILIKQPEIEITFDLEGMAKRAQLMVKRCLDAFVNNDVELAKQVSRDDVEVDSMRKAFSKIIIDDIRESPNRTEPLLELSSVVRHLERLGDMAKNVAREVVYMVEGEILPPHSPELNGD